MKKLLLALAAICFCSCISLEAALWGNCCERSCKEKPAKKENDCNRCGSCPMKKKCCEKKCEKSCKPACKKDCKKKECCGKKSCPKSGCGKSSCKTGCNKKSEKMSEEENR